jgi:hypothetical protein
MNAPPSSMKLSIARGRLASGWIGWSLFLLFVMIARDLGQHAYACVDAHVACDPHLPYVWWMSSFLPTLGVIAAVLNTTDDPETNEKSVGTFGYWLALSISVAYFVSTALPVFAIHQDPAAALAGALWVPALQAVATAFVARPFFPAHH